MQLFRVKGNQVEQIKKSPFKLEKLIQTLFETNLEAIMGLKLVATEFSIKDRRIDTLAYNSESRAFIIIEYKRERNTSVIDQGYSYLSLMLEYKAEFILEYNEKIGGESQRLKRSDVDWSQSRVIFVAPNFTHDQIQSTNFRDLPIELWEINRYEDQLIRGR